MGRRATGSVSPRGDTYRVQLTLDGRRWSTVVPPRANGRPITREYALGVRDELLSAFAAGKWSPFAAEEPARGPHTVASYVSEWASKLTNASADEDRALVARYVAGSELGAVLLSELRPRHVAAWLEALAAKRSARGGTLAPRTRRNAYSILQRAFARAVIDEELLASPCDVIAKAGALPRVRDKEPGERERWIYSRREAWLLTTSEAIPLDRRALYSVLLYTGARIGEAHALTWSDLDATAAPLARLTIARSVDSHTREVRGTKTGAVKVVPVHRALAATLERWRAALGGSPAPSLPLLPNAAGRARTYPSTRDLLERDLERLRIPRRGQLVHAMRRTFVSLARSDGARGDLLRWVTHAPALGSIDGYTSPTWAALCEAVACLDLDSAPDSAPPSEHGAIERED